jgi:choline-sulfatase
MIKHIRERNHIRWLIIGLVLSVLLLSVILGTRKENAENYNIMLIIIDDLRPDRLGCYGDNHNFSPAIDSLAKKSYIFENAFSQSGYTMPSHVSIFTSLYPGSHKVFYPFKDRIPKRVYTLAEILQIYGYRTAWFSRLGAPHLSMDAGFGRGFQEKGELGDDFKGLDRLLNFIEKNRKDKFFLALNARRLHEFYYYLPSAEEADKELYYRYLKIAPDIIPAKDISEHAELFNGIYKEGKTAEIKFLAPVEKRHPLEESWNEVIESWKNSTARQDPKLWMETYDDCIVDIDRKLIKPIVEKLKELRLLDKTVIIITSDHGEAFGEHSCFGHGFNVYDETIHVPLIFYVPHAGGYGKKVEEITQSIDIMPTVFDLLGVTQPNYLQGKSLKSLLSRKRNALPVHKYIFSQSPGQKCLRSLDWKLIIYKQGHEELYNLAADPGEKDNLCQREQKVALKLEAELKAWEASLPSYSDEELPFLPNVDRATQERIKKTGYW